MVVLNDAFLANITVKKNVGIKKNNLAAKITFKRI